MIRFNTLLAVVLMGLPFTSLPALAHDGVHIMDAYARVTGASGAIFLTIENHQDDEDRLISATTDVAEMAGLHTHMGGADGVMKMREVTEGFFIPAYGDHALIRGGDHIMLMGLTRALKDGDVIRLILTFERAGVVELDVPVDNARKTAPVDHSQMKHN
jgi:copper(I)-binding protein